MVNIPKYIGIFLIKVYQLFLRPLFPSSCRFYPTCSVYTLQSIEKYGLTQRVKYKAIRTDEDIIRLYKNASLLIYPSLYEGFGLPLVEAFSCGTPCATASGSCLEEVGGDAASYFNPLDPADIARVSVALLHNPLLAASYIEKGYVRAKLFTWAQTVTKTNEIYREFLQK